MSSDNFSSNNDKNDKDITEDWYDELTSWNQKVLRFGSYELIVEFYFGSNIPYGKMKRHFENRFGINWSKNWNSKGVNMFYPYEIFVRKQSIKVIDIGDIKRYSTKSHKVQYIFKLMVKTKADLHYFYENFTSHIINFCKKHNKKTNSKITEMKIFYRFELFDKIF